MRKILVLVFLIVVTAFSVFAANFASNFSYKLSDDVESIIWNFKKQEAEVYSFLQGAVYCWCKILMIKNLH